MNGKDFIEKSFFFYFYRKPVINKISPIFGPAGGNFKITIHGKNFVNLTRFSSEFVCVFKEGKEIFKEAAEFVNSTVVHCKAPPIFQGGSILSVGISNTGGQEIIFAEKRFLFYQIGNIEPLSGPNTESKYLFHKIIYFYDYFFLNKVNELFFFFLY